MPLDIDRQHHILVLVLARPLGQMHMHNTLIQRPLDVELEPQMLGAPLIRLLR